MRQSARLKSGKVTSKYISRGVTKKRSEHRNINSDARARDNAGSSQLSSERENAADTPFGLNANGPGSEPELSDDEEESADHNEDVSDERKEIENLDKEDALEYIKKNYSNPESIICYASVTGLKDVFKILSDDDIRSVLSTFETWSLMKSSRDPKIYNPFIAQHLRDVMQIDCVSMKEIADQNLGVNYLLCAIDVLR